MRIRALDAVEQRVLGALLEKEQSTPEYYPMTAHALVAACNQKSNREPVMELPAAQVAGALERLHRDVLVWRVHGARAERWEHRLTTRLGLDPASRALLTLLLLRGEQTPGELRARSDRLHAFATLAEVEGTLERLLAEEEPLLAERGRAPGQRERRFVHLLGGPAPAGSAPAAQRPDPAPAGGTEERLTRLEAEVAALRGRLDQLASRPGGG